MKLLSIMHPLACAFLLMLLGILTPLIGRADIYSWTDADGVRHFANKPPPGDVAAIRQIEEIPYDRVQDHQSHADHERYFDQRTLENVIRRLEQTERARAENQDRTQAVERWPDNMNQGYYDDAPYYGGNSYGDGGYDNYDRRDRGTHERRRGHHKDRAKKRPRDRSAGGDKIATPLPEWKIKQNRVRRTRRSKRDRGVTSGLTRVVRAVPSPYYMGYRPVYSRDTSYRSRGGADGRRGGNRRGSGGSRRSGGRARARF